MKQLLLLLFLFLNYQLSFSQFSADQILSGPMIGAVKDSATKVWFLLETQSGTSSVDVFLRHQGNGSIISSYSIDNSYCMDDTCSYVLSFSGLAAGADYRAVLTMNSSATDSSASFTVDDGSLADVEFLIGGCNLMHDPGDTYGTSSTAILDVMRNDPADFMVWTGDVLYLRYNSSGFPGMEYNDTSKMFARWCKSRTHPVKRAFKQSKFQLATWDDHDFGPNNAGSDYAYRDFSINMFKSFWGNASYPEDGVYSTYQYRDLEFFLTDNRSFQTQQDYLGQEQLDWLKAQLLSSTSTFKFVVIPSAVHWNWSGTTEISMYQSGERDDLYDFIYNNNVSGVIFLSGDKHKSYFAKYEPGCQGTYPLYEFMSSPMTSGVSSSVPDYIDMIQFYANYSYGKVRISGLAGNRVCTFEMKNASGTIVHALTFSENDLQASFAGPANTDLNVIADYDFVGNANDSTASALHGTLNGPTLNADRWGASNSGYEFDSYPETIDFPNTILNGRSSFSVSFWIYPTADDLGWISAASSTTGNEFLIFHDVGQIDFWIKNTKAEFDYNLSLNKWHNIVATRDGTTGEAQVYVDGLLIGKANYALGAMDVPSGALLFGNDQDNAGGGGLSSSQQFLGILDKLTFYDIVLCQYQIREIFEEGTSTIEVFDDTLCVAGTADFVVSGSATNSYNWYQTELSTTPIVGQTDSTYSLVISETTTFWVSANNFWSESERKPVTVYLNPTVYTDSVTFPRDLTAWYSFDANANDMSGNGYHATLNGPTPTVGYNSGAYEFDSYLETVTIPHQTLDGATHFAIGFWIKTNSSGQDGILSGASSTEANEIMLYIKAGGTIELYIHNTTKLSAKETVNDGNWHHVLVQANTTAGTSWIYIDGEAQPTLVGYHQRGKLELVSGGLVLGNDQDNPGGGGFDSNQQLIGKLDEFKIYRRLLDNTEIQALYTSNDYFKKPLNIIAPDSICVGESSQLQIITPQYNVEYNVWDDANTLLGTYFNILPTDTAVVAIGPFAATTLLNVVANPIGWNCIAPIDTSAEVYVLGSTTPLIIFSAPDTLCSNVVAATYNWWFNGTLLGDTTQCITVSGNGNYQVIAMVNNCPTDTSTAYWFATNQQTIKQEPLGQVLLYPNPIKEGHFNIDLGAIYEQVSIRILDAIGRTVSQSKYSGQQLLNIKLNQSAGSYFVEVIADDKLTVLKLISY